MNNLVGIDFEYFNSNEEVMTVVACVLDLGEGTIKFNCLDEGDLINLKFLLNANKDKIFIAYAVMAEARALLSIGIDPFQFKWVDLYVEFRMLCNSNNFYNYGNYIGDDGSIRYSRPPNPLLTEEEKEEDHDDHSEVPKNLINCAFKLLNVRLDAEEKETMRDLILSKDLVKIHAQMNSILEYCASDTKHLINIYKAISRAYEKEGLSNFLNDQLSRGRYSVATAKSEALGIPINMGLLDKIIQKTPDILKIHEGEVNGFFPYFIPEYQKPPITRKNGKVFIYKVQPAHKDMGAYQNYVQSLKIPNFPKTKSGKFKSDKETLEIWGYWKGLESLWKYNKMESCLKWFNKDNKNGFFDRVGSDQNVRPFYGIFGTQTGRNAAKAKTFPLAMSSWLRAIIQPKGVSSIIGCDFSQQEVYVAAILSNDRNLLEAYNSGDVYLAFAKQAGLVPETATKASHKLERMLCKATVLGLQFGMGQLKLKTKLSLDSGTEVSDEKTKELIDAHKNTYRDYWQWVREISEEYKDGNPLSTNDGWVLFCDNPIITSVRNFPVQANAASITRLAVVKAWEQGLKVMCGLHDAVYVISNAPGADTIKLERIMLEATEEILKESKTTMRIDSKVIFSDEIWIEEKSIKDIKKLAPYLELDSAKFTKC